MASTSRGATGGRVTGPTEAVRRVRLASPAAATGVGVVALVVPFAAIPLAILTRQTSFSYSSSTGIWLGVGLAFAAVGVVVARREPRNPIGWLLLAASLAMTAGGTVGPSYVYLDYSIDHRSLPLGPVAVVLSTGWVYAFMALPLILLFFPDGRLGSRWRWPVRVYLCALAVYTAGSLQVAVAALSLRMPIDSQGNIVGANHPHGWFGPVQSATQAFFVAFCIASVIYRVLSFRRSSGERRQQFKWLGAGGATAIIFLLTGLIWTSAPSFVGNILLPVALAALPASIGIGILRYRLYEIDRLISRTLAYAILTALLVGTFVGLVALTTDALAISGRVGVAASTLTAAALFNPLRKRVQRFVDRRFNRARYDAEATVAAFSARLRDAVELDAIRGDLLDAVNRAVEPTHASVWIKS